MQAKNAGLLLYRMDTQIQEPALDQIWEIHKSRKFTLFLIQLLFVPLGLLLLIAMYPELVLDMTWDNLIIRILTISVVFIVPLLLLFTIPLYYLFKRRIPNRIEICNSTGVLTLYFRRGLPIEFNRKDHAFSIVKGALFTELTFFDARINSRNLYYFIDRFMVFALIIGSGWKKEYLLSISRSLRDCGFMEHTQYKGRHFIDLFFSH